jgi:hypothetical protein
LAIKNILDFLPDLKFIIKREQNPLSKFLYFHIKASNLLDEVTSDDDRLNLLNIFDTVKIDNDFF